MHDTEMTIDNATARSIVLLNNFRLRYFNGIETDGQFNIPEFLTGISSNSQAIPLFIDGINAYRLNPEVGDVTFEPTGFISKYGPDSAESAAIFATDGVYVNSLIDSDGKMTNWRKLQTPAGIDEPFADWMTKRSNVFYSIKTSSNDISVCENSISSIVEIAKNDQDDSRTGFLAFYDLANADNSFILTTDRHVLNSDRTVCEVPGNVNAFSINGVSKIGNAFYAFINSDDIRVIYKTTSSPKTGIFLSTLEYNVFSNKCAGAVDFLEKFTSPGSHLQYNVVQRDNLWSQLSDYPMIWNSATHSEISTMQDMFSYPECYDLSNSFAGFIKVGDVSSTRPAMRTDTYEKQTIHQGSESFQGMVRWEVRYDGNIYAFDMRSSLTIDGQLYAIGNIYHGSESPIAVALKVPGVRTPSIVDKGDGTYYYSFTFDAENIYKLHDNAVVNGPAVKVSYNNQNIIVVPMLLSSGKQMAYSYLEDQLNWILPDGTLAFNEYELPNDQNLLVGDILLLDDSRVYLTIFNHGQSTLISAFSTYASDLLSDEGFLNISHDSHSIFNVVKDPQSNAAYVDFKAGNLRSIAHIDANGEVSFPFLENHLSSSTPPRTLLDYTVMYGASNISAEASGILSYFTSTVDQDLVLLGDSQLALPNAKSVGTSSVWTLDFSGSVSKNDFESNDLLESNSIVVGFRPRNTTVTSHEYTMQGGEKVPTPPASFSFTSNDFGIMSLRGFETGGSPICNRGVLVGNMSNAVTSDGYFYATINEVLSATYDNTTPTQIDDNAWEWRAEPVLGNTKFVLYKLDQTNRTITSAYVVESQSSYTGLPMILGPDSWSFLVDDKKFPDLLAFKNWSLVKHEIQQFDPNAWAYSRTISIPGGSRRYIKFSDEKILTWNSSKTIFKFGLDGSSPISFNGDSKFTGDIVGLQNLNNDTIYVFATSSPVRDQDNLVDLKIYSGPYSSFGSSWNPTLWSEIQGIDLLESGTIYLTSGATPEGDPIPVIVYSSSEGGIKTLPAKIGYSVVCDVLEQTRHLPVDGNVLKNTAAGILATGDNKLCSIITNGYEAGAMRISSDVGIAHDAFLNFATNYVSSYTLTDLSCNPTIIEISANGVHSIKDLAFSPPVVYNVITRREASQYGDVNFYSSDGKIYQLSSGTDTPIGITPYEVHNGKALLSGMLYGFPGKDEALSDYRGTIEEMHVSSFDVDLSSSERTVFIDNLYNTLKLSDYFEQTYWIATAQLDNRTSDVTEDGTVVWTHYPQRYKLNELYDQTFRFADVRNRGTISAETILTSQDGLFVYKAVPRADWDVSHLRKIVREAAHLDNACEELGLNPDYTSLIKDIQTSPYGSVLLLGSGHDIAVHESWLHNIKYFGTCVQPYAMFNSRIQDTYVTTISKYGNDDLNFVLGTSQGFIHLINGHLLAKAMHTDLDDATYILSGNCTYAGCHTIDNGTSIENRFLFANDHMLFNVAEHDFNAKCEINEMFELTNETINDIFRIGEGAYAICTNKGIYTSRPRLLIKDYLDDYVLSDLNNDIDIAFSRMLANHVKARHFAGSDMDVINHKIDKNFNPYPAGFTNASPVITSRHVLDVDNDLVEFMEVRLTDDQAATNASNIFAAVKNEALNAAATVSRTYAPPGWFDYVVDINDPTHIVDYSDVRYICRKWRSGVVEFYIYIPTTFTYYFNNVAGYSQSPYAGLSLVRPNAGNIQVVNSVNSLNTTLRLFISNTTYKLNTIYMSQIVGNSLPLKIYKDSTYCDLNRAGLFDSIIQPSVVRALPAMVGRSKNNVNALMNASEQICLDFSIYGTDAQAIHIMAR